MTKSIIIWRGRQRSCAKFWTEGFAINYRRTRRFYRRFHVDVRDRSRLCAFNTRWRGTFLARCNRMMIRYWPLTTHATLRGKSLLCGHLIRRENERWKCNDERERRERREEERLLYVHISETGSSPDVGRDNLFFSEEFSIGITIERLRADQLIISTVYLICNIPCNIPSYFS